MHADCYTGMYLLSKLNIFAVFFVITVSETVNSAVHSNYSPGGVFSGSDPLCVFKVSLYALRFTSGHMN